jgi:hypothetical protein
MIAHGMGDLQTVSAMALNAGIEMDGGWRLSNYFEIFEWKQSKYRTDR